MAETRPSPHPALTAQRAGLVGCRACGKVSGRGTHLCPRCGTVLHGRIPFSLQRTVALLVVSIMFYIPANMLPMLETHTLAATYDSTVMGGVIELVGHGAWDIALVVFVASVLVPVTKFFVVAYLVWSIIRKSRLSVETRVRLHEIVDYIGRWSMVDVFVVAILTALVQIGFFVSIKPGLAAIFFAISVSLTMLSAQSLDPRLIWDGSEPETPRNA